MISDMVRPKNYDHALEEPRGVLSNLDSRKARKDIISNRDGVLTRKTNFFMQLAHWKA